MFLSGLMPSSRVPAQVRVEYDVALARAWEALTATHEQQAVAFVRRLATRLGSDEALQRYFREVAVPFQLRETVRARALLALTPEERKHSLDEGQEPWTLLRPDHLVDAVRRRSRWVEETTLAIRLATAAAEESLTQTHTTMALETARVLAPAMPVDEALMQYIRAMELTPAASQTVFQRAMARLAESEVMVTQEMPVALPAAQKPVRVLGLRATG